MTKTGRVIRIIIANNFGFIKQEGSSNEYFFHRDDFTGHWEDMVIDFKAGKTIPVNFVEVRSTRGPRAEEVERTDHPNMGR